MISYSMLGVNDHMIMWRRYLVAAVVVVVPMHEVDCEFVGTIILPPQSTHNSQLTQARTQKPTICPHPSRPPLPHMSTFQLSYGRHIASSERKSPLLYVTSPTSGSSSSACYAGTHIPTISRQPWPPPTIL